MYQLGELCTCVANHSPLAYVANSHHIIPKSWNGPDDAANRIDLCPNAHSSVHRLIDEYVRHGGDPGWEIRRRFSPFIRELALRAWDGRPEIPTYT